MAQVSSFGGLSTKFSPRYLVLLSTGELHIYNTKDDFDARKNPEDCVNLEEVNAKKVQSKSGTGATTGPQYVELFQPFKGQIELCFSNVMAQLLWLDCIEQVQAHLKRIERQKAELGGAPDKSSAAVSSRTYADCIHYEYVE